jgi:hypothetical protein
MRNIWKNWGRPALTTLIFMVILAIIFQSLEIKWPNFNYDFMAGFLTLQAWNMSRDYSKK